MKKQCGGRGASCEVVENSSASNRAVVLNDAFVIKQRAIASTPHKSCSDMVGL